MGDGEASAPLLALLAQLAPQAREAQAELEALEAERQEWAQAQTHLARVLAWCQTVAANLDTLTYAEKRTALDVLAVSVQVYPPGMATDAATGQPIRWRATMRPLGGAAPRVLTSVSGS